MLLAYLSHEPLLLRWVDDGSKMLGQHLDGFVLHWDILKVDDHQWDCFPYPVIQDFTMLILQCAQGNGAVCHHSLIFPKEKGFSINKWCLYYNLFWMVMVIYVAILTNRRSNPKLDVFTVAFLLLYHWLGVILIIIFIHIMNILVPMLCVRLVLN